MEVEISDSDSDDKEKRNLIIMIYWVLILFLIFMANLWQYYGKKKLTLQLSKIYEIYFCHFAEYGRCTFRYQGLN